MLKLIERQDAKVEHKESEISLRFGRAMPEHSAEIHGILQKSKKPEISVGIYAMRHCISELSVKGEKYDAVALSYVIDVNDAANATVLTHISCMAVEELILTEQQRGKSSGHQEHSGQANDAKDAP